MSTGILIVFVAVAVAGLLAGAAVRAYLRYRGTRIVTCPGTGATVAVEVDAAHAAITAAVRPELRLTACTLWPEREHCGQMCLDQIEASPESCLLRAILAHWYEGKVCALCGKPFEKLHLMDHRPALLTPEGRTLEWREIPAASVYVVLAAHRPVCWNCHIAESFRRAFPDRVLDVPSDAMANGTGLAKPTSGNEGGRP